MLQIKLNHRLTNRQDTTIDRYLKSIAKFPVLSPQQEEELIKLIKQGKTTPDYFINCNLKFVVSVAKQYQQNNIPLIDLISAGNIGLIRALQTFDETKGFKFISYAVWWIRNYITQELQNKFFYLPQSKVDKIKELKKKQKEIALLLDSDVSLSSLSSSFLISYTKDVQSLDEPINETMSLCDMISSEESFKIDCDRLDYLLRKILSDKEYYIIVGMYKFDKTQSCIAESLDLTRERVRQLCVNALKKLRKYKIQFADILYQ